MTRTTALTIDDAIRGYRRIVFVRELARGCFWGIYAWYLTRHLGFSPGELSLIIGAQLLLQILLEIPSGTWAEERSKSALLCISLGCHAAFAGLFLLASWDWTASFRLELLIGAEALYGVGGALYSGTLDAWASDIVRARLAEQFPESINRRAAEFHRHQHRLKSWKQLARVGLAATGFVGFWSALHAPNLLWTRAPWGAAMVLYLWSMWFVYRWVDRGRAAPPAAARARTSLIARCQAALRRLWASQVNTTGRHTHRSLSYLRESRWTLGVLTLSSLAYVPIYCVQAFWVVYLTRGLGITERDDLYGALPFLAVFWLVGELVSVIDSAWQLLRSRERDRIEPRASKGEARIKDHVLPGLKWLTAGLLIQGVAPFVREPAWTVLVLGLGWIVFKLGEGMTRRRVDALLESSVVSERATQMSIANLGRSVFGLLYLATVAALIARDPALGYLALGVVCLLLYAAVYRATGDVAVTHLGEKSIGRFRQPPPAQAPAWPDDRFRWLAGVFMVLPVASAVILAIWDAPIGGLTAIGDRPRVEVRHQGTAALHGEGIDRTSHSSTTKLRSYKLRSQHSSCPSDQQLPRVHCRIDDLSPANLSAGEIRNLANPVLAFTGWSGSLTFSLRPCVDATVDLPVRLPEALSCHMPTSGGKRGAFVPVVVIESLESEGFELLLVQLTAALIAILLVVFLSYRFVADRVERYQGLSYSTRWSSRLTRETRAELLHNHDLLWIETWILVRRANEWEGEPRLASEIADADRQRTDGACIRELANDWAGEKEKAWRIVIDAFSRRTHHAHTFMHCAAFRESTSDGDEQWVIALAAPRDGAAARYLDPLGRLLMTMLASSSRPQQQPEKAT